jgi:hypothetical protein
MLVTYILVSMLVGQSPAARFSDPERLCRSQKVGSERSQPNASKRWRKLEGDIEYSCVSESEIGPRGANGLNNTILLMATSDTSNAVKRVELMVRIFNEADAVNAYRQFPEAVRAFLDSGGFDAPPKLLKAVETKRPFKAVTNYGTITFAKSNSNIEEWVLTISAK